MTVTSSGIFYHPHRCKLLLANCATFQAIVGAVDAATALPYIAVYEALAQTLGVPRAMILRSEDWERRSNGIGSDITNGSLMVGIWMTIPATSGLETIDTIEDEYTYVENIGAAILSEMEALRGTGEPVAGQTHLWFISSMISEGPFIATFEEMDLAVPETGNSNVGYIEFALEVR